MSTRKIQVVEFTFCPKGKKNNTREVLSEQTIQLVAIVGAYDIHNLRYRCVDGSERGTCLPHIQNTSLAIY